MERLEKFHKKQKQNMKQHTIINTMKEDLENQMNLKNLEYLVQYDEVFDEKVK